MIEWFARNSVAANLLMIGIVVAGLLYLRATPIHTFPESEPDTVTVGVVLRGATPEDMELGVAVRIEEAVADLVGIGKITSTSSEGSATVVIETDTGTDPRDLLNDIKNRVDSINTFPVGAERPVVALAQRLSSVIQVLVSGPFNEREIRTYTEKVRDDLLKVDGITSAELAFDRNYEISIEVSQDKLREFDMSLAQVARAISGSSLDVSAGNVRTQGGDVLIRSQGQAYTKTDFDQIVVRTNPDGSILRVADIADVNDGFEEDGIGTSFNGGFAGMIQVFRTGEQGAIDVADEVKKYIEEQTPLLPVGMELAYWDDDSEVLKQRLGTLISNMVTGGILVILLLALFLRPAVSFWVFLGIPISFIGSFIVLGVTDTAINMMSLFGYIIVLGIVVDDAIVTGESIYASMGPSRSGLDAVVYGTKRVAIPVTFGVITTMAAFLPMLFLEGRFARFMAPIPGVVISVLLFSLIESKFVLPAHLKHIKVRPTEELSGFSRWQQQFSQGFENLIIQRYRPVLDVCVSNRYAVLTGFICVFVIIIVMLQTGHSRYQAFPRVPADAVTFSVNMPVGTPFSVTDRHVQRIAEEAERLREQHVSADGSYALRHILALTGSEGRGANPSAGSVQIETDPELMEEIGYSVIDLTQDWRIAVGEIVGAEAVTIRSERFRAGDPVDVELRGTSFDQLSAAADQIKTRLASYDSVYEIADSFSDGKEELRVDLTQQGHVLGLTRSDILSQVSQAFQGFQAQRIQRGRDDIRVLVRLPKDERSTTATLEEILITTPSGQEVPLSHVAEIAPDKGPASIRRVDRFRVVNVTADYDKEKVNSVAFNTDLAAYLDELMLQYPGVQYRLSGEAEEEAETFGSMGQALVVLLMAIYCLLALPLKSYIQPLIVMSIIPFSIIGSVLGHTLMGQPVTMLSILGMLALVGVVVNDSLVLVDYTNQAKLAGNSTKDSILNAGSARFRAVMLTSLTTFFGLLPMMFATNVQSAFLVPMAISLGYGIVFGSLITLVLVPSLLMMAEDGRRFFSSPSRDTSSDTPIQA